MRQTLRKWNTRLLALGMAMLLIFCQLPIASAAEYSGKCGKNLSWSLNGDTLVITGSGDMANYREYSMAPWYEHRGKIAAVVLPEGLTRVGDLAFYGCTALTSVKLPDSVKAVGWHAFDGCTCLTMLDLGKVQLIEDAAFRECTSLKSLRLPGTLTTLNYQAFYRCESLAEVSVPRSVTQMGMTVFAFCYNLVRADIRAQITSLPDWTFYGCSRLTELSLPASVTGADEYAFYECDSLNVISYAGSQENKAQLRQDLTRDGGSSMVSITGEPLENTTTGSYFQEVEDSVVSTTTTTATTDNGSISTEITVTYPEGNVSGSANSVQVDITLENSNGWTEVQEYLDQTVMDSGGIGVNVYIKDDSSLPSDAIGILAGESNTVTVHTSSGSVWRVKGTDLNAAIQGENLSFSHQRVDATQKQLDIMGCAVGFQVVFRQSAEINAQVLIRMPIECTRATATLYQVDKKELTLLQSVVVDNIGYAHFYLASVDKDTEYLIGINVPGIDAGSVIVPEELYGEYGITDLTSPVQYVITGRTSSWGLSLGQVTLIMIGVLVVCVIGIGAVMFALNKRKLRKGYVPEDGSKDL